MEKVLSASAGRIVPPGKIRKVFQMAKNILCRYIIFLLTFLLLAVFSPTASAAKYGDFSYEVNEETDTVTITGYSGSASEVTIPSKIEGKSVTSIGYNAFFDCGNLISIDVKSSNLYFSSMDYRIN